jgi:mannose-6-phosphate isomerase
MYENDTFVERPWGRYMKLYQEAGVWVKRVEVNPGGRLSLQRHHKRSEKWIIVKGLGLAVVNGQEHELAPGMILDVPIESEHRIGNIGEQPLVFIETAVGEYLGEDDIMRIDDDYCRVA